MNLLINTKLESEIVQVVKTMNDFLFALKTQWEIIMLNRSQILAMEVQELELKHSGRLSC